MELDRNQALKRIREEYREIESNPSDEFMCALLKRKKFQWQFAVRGASGTDFEGGIYHGRVLFPREYPCKPPSIIALTENGRFKTHTEISLRRLDKWQPSYRVRDVFVDFVHLMPTYPDELCSLECNKEERRALASKSRAAAPEYGSSERQKVIERIHEYMLSKVVPVPQLQLTRNTPCQMESDRSVIAEDKCNIKNAGEIESNPSYDFTCRKLRWNKYEWQFAIRGPNGTEFEGGIYHGLVQFSEEYPSKSPSIIFLTENGCFKIQISMPSKKFQISMSSKKIQTSICLRLLWNWESSWSVRKTLFTFIEETPTYPIGELFQWPHPAIKFRAAAPKLYEYLLSKVPVPQLQLTRNTPCQKKEFKNLSCDFGKGDYMGLTEKIYIDKGKIYINIWSSSIMSKNGSDVYLDQDRGVIAEDKCNIKNSGEKRILEEYNEIESNPSHDFKCLKLGWNKYEWQFAIRGPSGTEFEGGIYHGVIQFSEEYPSKPPSIMFLTKNGRFKIQTNISSRLSSNWQSPRSVRNALVTLIEEMPTYPDGDEELDSVKYSKEVRCFLAIKSRGAAPKCGPPKRQKLIDEIHEYMLSKAPPVPPLQLSRTSQACFEPEHEHEHEHSQNDGAKRKHGRGGDKANIMGNIFYATNDYGVGIFSSMNEAYNPKPMITKTKLFWVFLFSSILFGFWSFRG